MNKKKALIDISKKTFIQVTALLAGLLIVAIVLTFIIPAGSFGTHADGSVDYSVYQASEGSSGIAIWKGVLAPVLVGFIIKAGGGVENIRVLKSSTDAEILKQAAMTTVRNASGSFPKTGRDINVVVPIEFKLR